MPPHNLGCVLGRHFRLLFPAGALALNPKQKKKEHCSGNRGSRLDFRNGAVDEVASHRLLVQQGCGFSMAHQNKVTA